MISNIGYFSLIGAIFLGIYQAISLIQNININLNNNQSLFISPLILFHLLIISSYLCLLYLFVSSDMSVITVLLHSSSIMDMKYKISATWGSHESSMLFWQFIISLISGIFIFQTKLQNIKTYYISSILQSSFIIYFIIFANPFKTIISSVSEGIGMNPSLQDIGMMIHPPILFLSYATYQIIYSITISKIMGEVIEEKILLFWSRIGLSTIFGAIGLGGWWAYRELGWGGYWFFDPVENISLIVLLFGIASHHTFLQKEMSLEKSILGILPFISAISGTFLTRSGLLNSVHSFAESNGSISILIFILIISVISFGFVFFQQSYNKEKTFSRKYYFIQAGNILFALSNMIIFLSLIIPIISSIFFNNIIEIKPNFFTKFLLPILLLASMLSGIIYFNRSNLKLSLAFLIPLPIIPITIYLTEINLISSFSFYVSIVIILSSLYRYFERCRDKSLNIAAHSMLLGHISIGMLIFAITLNVNLSFSQNIVLKNSEKIKLENNLIIHLRSITEGYGKNYIQQSANISVFSKENEIAHLKPELRFYPVEKTFSTEVDIFGFLFYDVYASINNIENDRASITIYYHPAISFIWFSIFICCFSIIIRNIKK